MSNKSHTHEIPVVFECQGQQLIGMIHQAGVMATTGVLVIVGGPQYRAGSHRQFVLLTRHLAAQGIPAMRFDVRGMGDSEGSPRNFQQLDNDIQAAIDCFLESCPALSHVVLWGLCDAASAALFYGYQDSRVKGLVLLNPWVFTEQGAAKTYLKHYYLQRLFSKDLWRKVFSFKFDYANSMTSLLNLLKQAAGQTKAAQTTNAVVRVDENMTLPMRMRECLRQFAHPVLLILSGRDLTADEFKETVKGDPEWQSLLSEVRVTRRDFAEADHTFSSAAWRDQVAEWTSIWVKSL
ncbi:hydrolase 1, exosortase A system-associated [Methylobacter sp.]|uniref:hydrolase 1, exosortase A system-associated n=1 Tax=Methylobacter sp. TaxID=2051955 RepID=UPI00121B2743|nr:hydrolase 1, exosortase A system-associated [Methylobacter sp.]TAK65177.1 MAG: hydrolase 1, exosortase A system-associated [Methylobacter sp.]